jgi:hypothetical protein
MQTCQNPFELLVNWILTSRRVAEVGLASVGNRASAGDVSPVSETHVHVRS